MTLPAGPDAVARVLADPEFTSAVARSAGALDQHVDVTGDPAREFTVTSRRALPTDQIPAHLRGFVGTSIEIRQVEAWEAPQPDGARAGTVLVEITGAPVRLTGRAHLAGTGPTTSELRYAGEIRAAVPLFGAAVEQAVAAAVRSALAATGAEAVRRLAAGSGHDTAEQP